MGPTKGGGGQGEGGKNVDTVTVNDGYGKYVHLGGSARTLNRWQNGEQVAGVWQKHAGVHESGHKKAQILEGVYTKSEGPELRYTQAENYAQQGASSPKQNGEQVVEVLGQKSRA